MNQLIILIKKLIIK